MTKQANAKKIMNELNRFMEVSFQKRLAHDFSSMTDHVAAFSILSSENFSFKKNVPPLRKLRLRDRDNLSPPNLWPVEND